MAILNRVTQNISIVVSIVLSMAAFNGAYAAKKATAKQLDKIIDGITKSAGVANGNVEVADYDPAKFDMTKAKVDAKDEIKGYAEKGVTFALKTTLKDALKAIKNVENDESDGVPEALQELDTDGALQAVVSYYIADSTNEDYYSIPYLFDVYVQYPSGEGKLVKIFYEQGD